MNILAIDIGGTFIKYALMDGDCGIREKGKIPTPGSGREALVDALCTLFESFRPKEVPEGMAIALPGIIDSENGYVAMGGALAYNNDFYFRKALQERCPGIKIVINNDAKCAALAEASVGALCHWRRHQRTARFYCVHKTAFGAHICRFALFCAPRRGGELQIRK